MIVTVNTDASYSHYHRKGSFAFWIVCNDFRILKSGLLKNKVERSQLAEFKCIINALYVLFNEDCNKITRIIINTDCLDVIHIIENDLPKIKKYKLEWGFPVRKIYNNLISTNNMSHIKIELRHVKSHTGIGDARSYVNEWCDTNAKKQLGKYLQTMT